MFLYLLNFTILPNCDDITMHHDMKILLKFYKDADEVGLKEDISTSGKQGNVKVEKNSHL